MDEAPLPALALHTYDLHSLRPSPDPFDAAARAPASALHPVVKLSPNAGRLRGLADDLDASGSPVMAALVRRVADELDGG